MELDRVVTTSARRRRLATSALLLVLLVLALTASIALGARTMSVPQVWHGLVGDGSGGGSAQAVHDIIWRLRVPRTLIALACGIALGMAGALTQGHTRNPLADPGLLGVSAGAAFAVVIAIFVFHVTGAGSYVWFAFLGAAVASVVVFSASGIGGGRTSPLTLVLAGAAVSAFLLAMTNAVTLRDPRSLDAMRFWSAGSVSGRDLGVLTSVLPFLVAGAVLALLSGPMLNLLNLGDDVARSLGTNLTLARCAGIAAITLLAGGATAVAGPISFVGLMVPHVARSLSGPDYRWIIPQSGLLGAVLLLVADVAGRLVARPGEIQVGIILAFVGAPFFIALVRRRRLVAV